MQIGDNPNGKNNKPNVIREQNDGSWKSIIYHLDNTPRRESNRRSRRLRNQGFNFDDVFPADEDDSLFGETEFLNDPFEVQHGLDSVVPMDYLSNIPDLEDDDDDFDISLGLRFSDHQPLLNEIEEEPLEFLNTDFRSVERNPRQRDCEQEVLDFYTDIDGDPSAWFNTSDEVAVDEPSLTNNPMEDNMTKRKTHAPKKIDKKMITGGFHFVPGEEIEDTFNEVKAKNDMVAIIGTDSYKDMERLQRAVKDFGAMVGYGEVGPYRTHPRNEFIVNEDAVRRYIKRLELATVSVPRPELVKYRSEHAMNMDEWGVTGTAIGIKPKNVIIAVSPRKTAEYDVPYEVAYAPSSKTVANQSPKSMRLKYKTRDGNVPFGDISIMPATTFDLPLMVYGHSGDALYTIEGACRKIKRGYAERFSLYGVDEMHDFLRRAESYGINVAPAKAVFMKFKDKVSEHTTNATKVWNVTVINDFDDCDLTDVSPFSWFIDRVQLENVVTTKHEATGEQRYVQAYHPKGAKGFTIYSISNSDPLEVRSVEADVTANRIVLQESDWVVDKYGNYTEGSKKDNIVLENPDLNTINKELIKYNLNVVPAGPLERLDDIVQIAEEAEAEKVAVKMDLNKVQEKLALTEKKAKAKLEALEKAEKEKLEKAEKKAKEKREALEKKAKAERKLVKKKAKAKLKAFKKEQKAKRKALKRKIKAEAKEVKRKAKAKVKAALKKAKKEHEKYLELKLDKKRHEVSAERTYHKLDQKYYKAERNGDVSHLEHGRKSLETQAKLAESGFRVIENKNKAIGGSFKILAMVIGIGILLFGVFTANPIIAKVGATLV